MEKTMKHTCMMTVIMTVVLTSLFFTAISTCAAYEEENFIQDGSFELEPETYWEFFNKSFADVNIMTNGETDGPAGGGANYLSMTKKDSNKNPYIYQAVSDLAGGSYKLTLSYKCPGDATQNTSALYKLVISEKCKGDENATVLETKQAFLNGTNDVWTNAEISVNLNWTEESTERKVELLLYAYNVDETVYYDLIALKTYVAPLVKNGDFSENLGASNWSWYRNATIETSNNEKYIAITGEASSALANQAVDVPAGSRIKLSFKFKTDTEGTKPYVSVRSNPEAIAKADYNADFAPGSTDKWTTYSVIVQYNSDAANEMTGYSIYLRGSGEGITSYFDDVTMEIVDQVFLNAAGTDEVTSFAAGDVLKASWSRISELPTGSTEQEKLMLIAVLYETKNNVKKIVSIAPVAMDTLGAANTQGSNGTYYIPSVKVLNADLTIPALDPDADYTAKMFCLNAEKLSPYEQAWVINK